MAEGSGCDTRHLIDCQSWLIWLARWVFPSYPSTLFLSFSMRHVPKLPSLTKEDHWPRVACSYTRTFKQVLKMWLRKSRAWSCLSLNRALDGWRIPFHARGSCKSAGCCDAMWAHPQHSSCHLSLCQGYMSLPRRVTIGDKRTEWDIQNHYS